MLSAWQVRLMTKGAENRPFAMKCMAKCYVEGKLFAQVPTLLIKE